MAAALFLFLGLSLWADPAYRDGSYEATITESGLGTLTVLVTVKDGRVSQIELPKGKCDLDMADSDIDGYIKTLIAAPVVMEVDAISGSTASCNLLKNAVYAALEKAK